MSDNPALREFMLDRDQAVQKSIGYIETSPDEAARALELEQVTRGKLPPRSPW